MISFDTAIDPADENLAFAEPWNARAFGLVIALSERGLFTLKDFQTELISSIDGHEKSGCVTTNEDYYTHWIEALTTLLKRRDLLSGDAIAAVEARLLKVAAETRDHQHEASYRPDGSLRVEPLTIVRPEN